MRAPMVSFSTLSPPEQPHRGGNSIFHFLCMWYAFSTRRNYTFPLQSCACHASTPLRYTSSTFGSWWILSTISEIPEASRAIVQSAVVCNQKLLGLKCIFL